MMVFENVTPRMMILIIADERMIVCLFVLQLMKIHQADLFFQHSVIKMTSSTVFPRLFHLN